MLNTLVSKHSRPTILLLWSLALFALITGLLFGGGSIGSRLGSTLIAVLISPITFGGIWLVIRLQIWVSIIPKSIISFLTNFIFIFFTTAAAAAVLLPVFVRDTEQPGSSIIMAFACLAAAFSSFRLFNFHLKTSPSAA